MGSLTLKAFHEAQLCQPHWSQATFERHPEQPGTNGWET